MPFKAGKAVKSNHPKVEKMSKYSGAAMTPLELGFCTQRAMQAVAGGLPYFSMFRRPIMSVLNIVWRVIRSFEVTPQRRLPILAGDQSELCSL